MNKKQTIIVIILLLIFLSFSFIIFMKKDEPEINDNSIIDITNISKCTTYNGEACELEFKDVKLGTDIIDIRYEITKNEEEGYKIEFFFDDFSVYKQMSLSNPITLFNLKVIDEVVFIHIGDDENSSFTAIDKFGSAAMEYNYFISDLKIDIVTLEDTNIIVDVTNITGEQEFDYYNICSPDFYSASGYEEDTIANAKYEIKYLGNKKFATEELKSSETIAEYIIRECN